MAGTYNLLCLAVIAIAFTNVIAVDYCNLDSCKLTGSTHTLCKYSSSTPAATCGQVSSVGLNANDKQAIVKKHNELRQRVASGQEKKGNPGWQPPAVSMPDLTWDNELEKIAQRWANQCNFNHDKCRNVDRFAVGQNIAQKSSTGGNNFPVESFVQMWYDEVDKFDKNKVSKYEFDPNTGHYTQVVWADTKKVGCGQISYKSNGWNTKYVVCNYGPSGNWIGQKIYEVKK
ncbi:venom allergen 3-like isoform X1 [Temnothorax longispinosus]|uniref:venom allergen 3-like isoform X1 n=1 Tax=Temnothorax longispinosus TaxID=300112 RepID=UPI003A9A4689